MNWTIVKTSKRSRADRKDQMGKHNDIVIPYVAGTSEKLRRLNLPAVDPES